jgi:hypothetical protein
MNTPTEPRTSAEFDRLAAECYRLGQRGWATQRPADSPDDLTSGWAGIVVPAEWAHDLYHAAYCKGYNDAYADDCAAHEMSMA